MTDLFEPMNIPEDKDLTIQLLEGRIEEFNEIKNIMKDALEFIKEKTKTDPAEPPELRARALVVYVCAKQALDKIND